MFTFLFIYLFIYVFIYYIVLFIIFYLFCFVNDLFSMRLYVAMFICYYANIGCRGRVESKNVRTCVTQPYCCNNFGNKICLAHFLYVTDDFLVILLNF